MTHLELREVIENIAYRDWQFDFLVENDTPFLRVRFDARDTDTGEPAEQKGRKWRLSPHMVKTEVVTTALKAVLAAVEHEAREEFLYRDVAVFGPHIDVDALLHAAGDRDVRAVV